MKFTMMRQLTAAALCLAMVVGLLPQASASSRQTDPKVVWQQVDNDRVSAEFLPEGFQTEEEPLYSEDDMVRVSIVLEDQPTLSVYSGENVTHSTGAVRYRNALELQQNAVAAAISRTVLNNESLDVVWNLTLASNAISANVPYGSVEAIKEVDGVADVFLEQRYAPCASTEASADPMMKVATGMTGTTYAWASGFTGAGSRVAIIDTGLDIEHQSVNDDAFQHSLKLLAQEKGLAAEDFIAREDLLDKEELGSLLSQLNAYKRSYSSVEQLYVSSKIPFGFNYVDNSLNITHEGDGQGDHGSHVAGIAAANRFLKQSDGSYVSAMQQVHMVGAAPDAQILVMKVFGYGGGAYESDYMVAIEDAIVLGCDTVNLSLGTPFPGLKTSSYYQYIMDTLGRSGTIATIAASNSSYWSEHTNTPTKLLYGEDVMFQTTSAPATFTNALSIAAVDNDGVVGRGFYVTDQNGHFAAYNEPSDYGRKTFGSLDVSNNGSGTFYDFIWVDGIGLESDYAGLNLTGKVVFCSRGEIQFGEKASIAVARGAAAVVIYNDVPGSFNMRLDGYDGTVPCVSISKTDGEAVRSASVDHDTYRTGRILITNTVSGSNWNSEYYTMSASSSWGVPGDLSIKPEISAPGGNIWSLKGTESSHDQYQIMGGTSMAAPQVAGIGALVMQAIEDRNLSRTDLSDRQLAQSLLMSTAVPMRDHSGNYYPILQQGSGLVNAGAAATADAYITVEGAEDGKVKAELGDDPDRRGHYSFTFTIHNLDGKARKYSLSGDVFTQDTIEQGGISWMALNTQPLNDAVTGFAVPGIASYDFDGNGILDTNADGQALLAFASGHLDTISCREYADFSGDGQITTYDAHLFLNRREQGDMVNIPAGGLVEVPANSSLDITVNISLSKGEMDGILEHCPNGVYLQAYVYAEPQADAEGAVGTAHSIPVLGFYGNWTDPSMYDKGSYQEYHYRSSSSPYRNTYIGAEDVNTFMVTYGGNTTTSYALGGNPVDLVDKNGTPAQLDRQYLESRNAMNNRNGDALYSMRHAPVRNSIATRFTATDANTGELYYVFEDSWNAYSAYYDTNAGVWMNSSYIPYIGWAGTDLWGYPLPENTVVNLTYTRAPEYYANDNGSIRWDEMGKGASFTSQVTIDNTAPSLISTSVRNNDLTVTVHDNQYVAAVVLLDALGERQLSFAGGNQMVKNVQTDVVLYVDDVVGKSFMLQIFDYAMNVSTYQVTVEGLESEISNYYTGYDKDDRAWYAIDESGAAGVYALDSRSIYAAERIGDYVFAADSTQDGTANFYVMPANDLAKIETVGHISAPHPGEHFYIADMAYHYQDRTMYFVYYSGHSDYGDRYGLATVDLMTGEPDFTSFGPLGENLRGLAIDANGTFYGVGDNYQLYTYTKDTYDEPRGSGISVGNLMGSPTRISLTWDAQKDELVMADHRSEGRTLYTVDVETGAVQTVSPTAPGTLWGLHVKNEMDPGQDFSKTNVPSKVIFADSSVKVLLDTTYQLSATVYPWTLTDRSIVWSSDNDSIASVDQSGQVTGNRIGSCTITAASKLDAGVFAECTVEVTNIKSDFNALVQDNYKRTWWSSFNTDELSSYDAKQQSDARLLSAVYASDGWIYGTTWNETAYTSDFYRVDPNTMQEIYLGSVSLRNYDYDVLDLADAPNLGNGNEYIVGVSHANIVILNRSNGAIVGVVQSAMGLSAPLVGIAYAGKMVHPERGVFDTYYAIDYYGKVYWVGLQVESVSAEGLLTMSLIGRTNDYIVAQTHLDTDYVYYYNSAHYTEDSSGTPLLFWSYYKWGKSAQMLAIDADKTGALAYLGTFPYNVYSVGGLMDDEVPAISRISSADVTIKEAVNDLESFHSCRGQNDTAYPIRDINGELIQGGSDMDQPAQEAAAEEKPAEDPIRSSASAVIQSQTAINGQENGSDRNVSVTLAAGRATTNGLLRISYDPELLTFVNNQGNTLLYSSRKDADGSITIGYAGKSASTVGSTLSQLSFTAARSEFETSITVTIEQEGAQSGGSEQVEIPVRRISQEIPPVRHTVTFDLNGGNGDAPITQTVEDGALADKPADPSRGGYTFRFWSVSADGEGYDFSTPVNSDLTLYAIWQADEPEAPAAYTIQASASSGGSITPSGTVTVTEGESQTFDIRADDGYDIADVTVDGVSLGVTSRYTFQNVNRDHTITAVFSAVTGDKDPTDPTDDPTDAPEDDPTETPTETPDDDPADDPTESPTTPGTEPVPDTSEPEEEPGDPLATFRDLDPNQWYSEYVRYMLEHGLMNGISSDLFNPDGLLNRAMVVTILHRIEGEPAVKVTDIFEDVKSDTWYTEAVAWAADKGIVTGYDSDRYGPTDPVTREQLATILWRYAKFKNYDVSAKGTVMPSFVDRDKISGYAGQAISWAYSRGILTGRPGNVLDPIGTATRAEVSAMLVRFLRAYDREKQQTGLLK